MCLGSSCTAKHLLWKNIKYGENKHNRTRTKLRCFLYRNDVIPSVLLLHIRANLSMMLAWDYASCHVARSTLVMLVANIVRQLKWPAIFFKSYWPLVGPIETPSSCIAASTKSQGRVLFIRCVRPIPQQYTHRHILSMNIRYLAVDATPGGLLKWNWIRRDLILQF